MFYVQRFGKAKIDSFHELHNNKISCQKFCRIYEHISTSLEKWYKIAVTIFVNISISCI